MSIGECCTGHNGNGFGHLHLSRQKGRTALEVPSKPEVSPHQPPPDERENLIDGLGLALPIAVAHPAGVAQVLDVRNTDDASAKEVSVQ